ncbi:MAG: thioredoxin domain-containing protein, partial [Patescibacteria group bacterium]
MENEIIKKKSSLAMPASILAAGFLIALAVLYTNGSSKENTPSDSSGSATVDASKILRQRDSDVVLGNPEAPVTVVEYSDFQCPFCGRFFHTTLSEFKENYIKTGQAKFIYRDFAFLGQESIDAAAAAKCAGDQGKFWDYHDYLFSHQSGENQGNFSV